MNDIEQKSSIPSPYNMAKTIDYLTMMPAKNGFIISYSEKPEEKKQKGTYDNCCWADRKEVFDVDDDDDASMDKAFTRFRELAVRQYQEVNS